MDIFDGLRLVGGLALFLLGMNLMGDALEKKAGGKLKTILENLTSNPLKGFLLGLGVTAIIQSSSATTVMVVGFVSAGVMTLHQAIYIIMGANVGTTVTAWLLSLAGIDGTSFFLTLLKPSSFTPVLALIGIVLYLFCKAPKRKDTGMILLGFAVLMTGMSEMSGAVSGLQDVPEFANFLLLFSNPLFGVLAGALLTAIIQSSSASVGILQALSSTGAVTYAIAIPIIMGQNIGTCVTALLASVDATKNAKRAAMVHLYFNIIGSIVLLTLFYGANAVFHFSFVNQTTDEMGIAIVHTAFNVLCTLLLMPFGSLLEKLACLTVKADRTEEEFRILDENLLAVPAVAVERCRAAVGAMAKRSVETFGDAIHMLGHYEPKTAEEIRRSEDLVDRYEDRIGAFLVKISAQNLSDEDSFECTKLLRLIGEFERISDHAVNLLESAEEIKEKQISFSAQAKHELAVITHAVQEITGITLDSLCSGNAEEAARVEPLEQVIDELHDQIKLNHVLRLQKNECTIEHGFILSDILTNLERVADHCSNVGVCIQEMSRHLPLGAHQYLESFSEEQPQYKAQYEEYHKKYALETA